MGVSARGAEHHSVRMATEQRRRRISRGRCIARAGARVEERRPVWIGGARDRHSGRGQRILVSPMRPGPLRMPLATGADAVTLLAIPTGFVQLVVFGPMFIADVPDWVPRWVGSVITILLGLLWAGWVLLLISIAI